MARPKLEVNEVWILQEVMPWEGNTILGVFFDPEVAKSGRESRGKWRRERDPHEGDDYWTTRNPKDDLASFYLITRHPIRTK